MSDNSDAQIMFDMVKSRYGDRLNDAQLDELKTDLENIADMLDALRKQPLENGDEPFSIFTPYRREG